MYSLLNFLNVEQCTNNDFLHSVMVVLLFLTTFSLIGFLVVKICKRGNCIKHFAKKNLKKDDQIRILDVKFLYGKRCLYFVSCCKKKILFFVDQEHSCKLGEWKELENEINR